MPHLRCDWHRKSSHRDGKYLSWPAGVGVTSIPAPRTLGRGRSETSWERLPVRSALPPEEEQTMPRRAKDGHSLNIFLRRGRHQTPGYRPHGTPEATFLDSKVESLRAEHVAHRGHAHTAAPLRGSSSNRQTAQDAFVATRFCWSHHRAALRQGCRAAATPCRTAPCRCCRRTALAARWRGT